MPRLGRWREALTIGAIAVLMAIAVYACLGLAWTFKTAVEIPQRFRATSNRIN